jgi:hypothetical protein
MKIFLLSRTGRFGYDSYDSCVVCAESEDDAKNIHPSGQNINDMFNDGSFPDWCRTIDGIICEEIGEANVNQERGVICASFNRG